MFEKENVIKRVAYAHAVAALLDVDGNQEFFVLVKKHRSAPLLCPPNTFKPRVSNDLVCKNLYRHVRDQFEIKLLL